MNQRIPRFRPLRRGRVLTMSLPVFQIICQGAQVQRAAARKGEVMRRIRGLRATLLAAVIGVATLVMFPPQSSTVSADPPADAPAQASVAPAEAMQRLRDGNDRF